MSIEYQIDRELRQEARDDARSKAIESRREELMADESDAGYHPWNPRNLSEALGEIGVANLIAVSIMLSAGTTAHDAAAGLLIRRHVERYWFEMADNEAVHVIDSQRRAAQGEPAMNAPTHLPAMSGFVGPSCSLSSGVNSRPDLPLATGPHERIPSN